MGGYRGGGSASGSSPTYERCWASWHSWPRDSSPPERASPPGITWVSGFPIAWDGLYVFPGVALAVGFLSTLRRGAGWGGSPILALAGLGAHEATYAFAFVLTIGGLGRLVPAPGFSATGWPGFGTWSLVELVVASLVVMDWEGRRLDSITVVVVVALSFVPLLATWDLVLGWGFPPYQDFASVLLVNSAAEVTGGAWLPLAFTAGPRNGRLPSAPPPGGGGGDPSSDRSIGEGTPSRVGAPGSAEGRPLLETGRPPSRGHPLSLGPLAPATGL